MNIRTFLHDRMISLLIQISGLALLCLYLYIVGNNVRTISIIVFFSVSIILGNLIVTYYRRKRYFTFLQTLVDNLEETYMIHELLPTTGKLEDALYKELMRQSNNAMIQRIRKLESEHAEYKDFVEAWIHEVKIPLTGLRLESEQLPLSEKKKMEQYITGLDNEVEKILFAARAGAIYKDYLIKPFSLEDAVHSVIQKNKYLLQFHNMQIDLEPSDAVIYSDEKWVEFMVGQITQNAMKYKKEDTGKIIIRIIEKNGGTILSIRDEGIGINAAELSRVTQKGFTGTNGRTHENATGMGLYICYQLCQKLDITLSITSKENVGTEVLFIFPIHNFYASER